LQFLFEKIDNNQIGPLIAIGSVELLR